VRVDGTRTYTIGLHYGARAMRCLLVDVKDGTELAISTWRYPRGSGGAARDEAATSTCLHPSDCLRGTQAVIRRALSQAHRRLGRPVAHHVVGIGVAAAGSMVLPIDEEGQSLACP
jgi:L-ribulokinase